MQNIRRREYPISRFQKYYEKNCFLNSSVDILIFVTGSPRLCNNRKCSVRIFRYLHRYLVSVTVFRY